MTDKQKYMIAGMDKLLHKFNNYSNDKEFTVADIIAASNEVYDEIIKEDK